MLCSWGRRGFMGLLGAGNGIPMSDCFIRWDWASFAAVAAFLIQQGHIHLLSGSFGDII